MAEKAKVKVESHEFNSFDLPSPRTEISGGMGKHVLVIGSAAFVTTFAQLEVIGGLPIRYLLKTRIGVTPQQMSLFLLLGTLAWYLKPLAGIVSDTFPLFGTRRRHYLMLSSAGAAIMWLMLGAVPRSYAWILVTVMILNLMMVFASTIMGGLLVEEAQKFGASGRFNSLREGVNMLAMAIGLPAGGYMAELAFGWTSLTAATMLLALSVVVYFSLHEEPVCTGRAGTLKSAGKELGAIFRSKPMMTAGAVLALFYITPGFATPLYFIQVDSLAFSQVFIGWLAVAGGITGILGAIVYSRVCRSLPLLPLLISGILLSAFTTLFYLLYDSRTAALIITGLGGFFGTFGVLPLFDLATRATPRGSEGLGFALMMSVRNLAVYSADLVGSWLIQSHSWSFSNLVLINAATTLLVLLVIPFLPGELLKGRDAGMPNPGTALSQGSTEPHPPSGKPTGTL